MSWLWLFLLLFLHDADGHWWFISQMGLSKNKFHCKNIPGLARRQRRMCGRHPDVMEAVAEGISLGMEECQIQFQNSKWNCSILPRDASILGRYILSSTRESSLIHAITAAAVVYSITLACGQGLINNCACDLTKKGNSRGKEDFVWSGCSDNIRFGSSFARRFIDSQEAKRDDAKASCNLHNNRAGRKSVFKNARLKCKCHGVSGSCTARSCWKSMASFRVSSRWLKKRYERAIATAPSPDGKGFIPTRGERKPRKTDLVYLESSPNYCQSDLTGGILGTGGRECTNSTDSEGNCDDLCCGNGFHSVMRRVTSKCTCSFQWCCFVTCKSCETWKEFHYCKPPQIEILKPES